MDTQIKSAYQHAFNTLSKLNSDIGDDAFTTRPHGVGNSPLWIMGHLAFVADFALSMFGVEAANPEFGESFGIGSSPDVASPEKFDRDTLLGAVESGYAKLIEKCDQADEEFMNTPHGLEFLENSALKTRGDLLCHLLTTHFAFHTAQMSACRRAIGIGPYL